MDDLEINLQRGDRARLLLEDELLIEMFKKIEEDCFREIRATTVGETEIRENAYLILKAMDILKTKLRSIHDTGKMAEVQIKRRGRPPKV